LLRIEAGRLALNRKSLFSGFKAFDVSDDTP
jgi:hypothetical protein